MIPRDPPEEVAAVLADCDPGSGSASISAQDGRVRQAAECSLERTLEV